MNLSVVIVTHNSAGVLAACWRSVRSAFPDAEIIVVDNASSDGTGHLSDGLPGVTLVANAVNAGFGRACNQGAAAAAGSHILFLNPDVEIRSVDRPGLEAESAQSPFGLVAPVIRDAAARNATVQPWARELIHHVAGPLRPRELPVLPGLPGLAGLPGLPGLPGLVELVRRRRGWWPVGAVLLVDGGEFARIGGFDPRFFLYYEDLDLARRYRGAGLPVRLTPTVTAVHRHGSSSTGETAGVAARHGWSYLSWIEYLCTWNGQATARRAANWSRILRAGVDRALALLERLGPTSARAARKRLELAELERFVRWQSSFGAGSAAADFCPRARRIVAAV